MRKFVPSFFRNRYRRRVDYESQNPKTSVKLMEL